MYFWNIKALEEDLRQGKVTPNEKIKYLFAFIVMYGFLKELIIRVRPQYYGDYSADPLGSFMMQWVSMQVFSVWTILRNGELLLRWLFILGGVIFCYQANRKGDNKEFIDRFVCLSLPVSIRFFAMLLPIILIGSNPIALYFLAAYLGQLLGPGPDSGSPFNPDSFFGLVIGVVYFIWIYRCLLRVSGAKGIKRQAA